MKERSDYNMPVTVKLCMDWQYPDKHFQSNERKSQKYLATFSYLSGHFYIRYFKVVLTDFEWSRVTLWEQV